jgi:hypothetical protein
MGVESISDGEFETFRQQLLAKSQDELSDIVVERFDEDFPPNAMFVGRLPDRVWQFVRTRVRAACDRAAELGADVWAALHDDHTAHNVERFALVCGFCASHVLKVGHWPAHEVAALVLLIIASRPKSGGGA